MKTKENGITLVALIITIILLLILSGIGYTAGNSTLQSIKFTQFTNELKVMQSKVNELNQENKTDIGQAISENQKNKLETTEIANIIYNGKTETEKANIQNGFRYVSKNNINTELNLDSIEREYLINVEYAYVIFPEGFKYNGTTYYMIDQIEGEVYNVRYNNKNENSGSFDVTVTKEDNRSKIQISNIQYNGYVDKWQVKYKLDRDSYWQTSDNLTFYLKDEGIYTIKVIHGSEVDLGEKTISTSEFDLSKGVNAPQINDGMIPIKYNGTNWVICSKDDAEWYDYATEKRLWANIMLCDGKYDTTTAVGTVVTDKDLGSMFVWIPRYAYQITSNCNKGGTGISGNINIKFLQGRTNYDSTGKEISTKYPTVTNNAMTDYVVHPSFTNGTANNFMNGEWDSEIPGFWVAKYAAGFQECTQTVASDGTVTEPTINLANVKYSDSKYSSYNENYTTNALGQTLTSTDYATQKLSYPVFKPLTYAYNVINTGDSYTISKEIASASSFYGLSSNQTDSHQMKNSEWGAVAYLTQSSYGRNRTEVTLNSKNLNKSTKQIYAVTGYAGGTANGVSASSTNNKTGVFDLNGCVWERTASYISNGHGNIATHGKSFASLLTANANGYKTESTKWATVYPYNSTSDSRENNYNVYKDLKSITYGFGDAILETSLTGNNSTSWNEDYSVFARTDAPFFERGGSFWVGSYAGEFVFNNTNGVPDNLNGFRVVLIKNN